MGEHSRFAPSSDERNTACPPSFLLNEKIPDFNTVYSAEGTAAHYVADICLKGDKDAELFAGCHVAVGPKGQCAFLHEKRTLKDDEMEFEVDDEMVNGVQMYLDICREPQGDHYFETRVEVTKWCPDVDENGDPLGKQSGTADHMCFQPTVMYVDDLKYGKGEQVFADHNKQATKYALGALEEYGWAYSIEKVIIRIIQPRLDHVDVWEVSVDELLAFGAEIKKQLKEVFNPKAKFNPGPKQCRFCKVSGRCKAQEEFLHSISALAFDDETKDGLGPPEFLHDPALLDETEMAEAWRMIPMLMHRIEALKVQMQRAMVDEVEFPGLKLVEAKTHRKWINEKKVVAWLKRHGVATAKLFKKKLVSPNEAEKLLTTEARHKLAEAKLFAKPPGGPAIADEDDTRPLYLAERDHSHHFDNEEDDGLD